MVDGGGVLVRQLISLRLEGVTAKFKGEVEYHPCQVWLIIGGCVYEKIPRMQ